MFTAVLDLTPSSAGWYYAGAGRSQAVSRRERPSAPAAALTAAPAESPSPSMLGYGPDGRLRRSSPSPRLWLLV